MHPRSMRSGVRGVERAIPIIASLGPGGRRSAGFVCRDNVRARYRMTVQIIPWAANADHSPMPDMAREGPAHTVPWRSDRPARHDPVSLACAEGQESGTKVPPSKGPKALRVERQEWFH